MAAITWADVVLLAPALSTVITGAQDVILAHVNVALSVDKFGGETAPRTKLARIYLAAHYGMLVSDDGDPTAGPIISESTGGVSRAYALTSPGAPSNWSGSNYGREYEALVRTSLARLPMSC